jgi:site-specific recombinase XerD
MTHLARSPGRAIARTEAAPFSADNPLTGFLAFLAEDTKVGERTARLYLAHLQRFAGWLRERYQASMLEATTRDLREYKDELAQRQKPGSVNAALAAVRRFYAWATEMEHLLRNPAQHLVDIQTQPLAPKGFSDTERRRLLREAERTGAMANAIVTVLLGTGLRVEELATLRWEATSLHERSGWLQVVGKGRKHRSVR